MAASSVNSLDSSPTYSGALSHVNPAGMLPLQKWMNAAYSRKAACAEAHVRSRTGTM